MDNNAAVHLLGAVLVLLLSLPATSCMPPPCPETEAVAAPLSHEEYAVWTTILADESLQVGGTLVLAGAPGLQPWLRDSETGEWGHEGLDRHWDALDPRTLCDFIHANARPPEQPDPTALLGSPVESITDAALNELFSAGGWDSFRARFGSQACILRVSRVGFDESRKRALVYRSITAGPHGGGGSYHVLELVDGNWVLKAERMAWIS